MARADYYAVESAIKTLLDADSTLTGVQVGIEEELAFGASTAGQVEIYLERRDAPADLQALRAGQTTRFLVRLSLWCYGFSIESVAKACQLRDDLMGKVEVALMANRTLSGSVNKFYLDGGEFDNQESPSPAHGFGMGGSIIVIADLTART